MDDFDVLVDKDGFGEVVRGQATLEEEAAAVASVQVAVGREGEWVEEEAVEGAAETGVLLLGFVFELDDLAV